MKRGPKSPARIDRETIKDRDVHSRIVADVAALAGGVRKLAKLAGMPFQAISELKCRKLSGVSPLNRAKLLRVAKLLWRKAGYSDYANRILELDGCYTKAQKSLRPREPLDVELQQVFPVASASDLPAELRAALTRHAKGATLTLPRNQQSPWYRSGWYRVTPREARSLAEIGASVFLHGYDWNNLPEDGTVDVFYSAPPLPPPDGVTVAKWGLTPVRRSCHPVERASELHRVSREVLELGGLVGPTLVGAEAEERAREAVALGIRNTK